MPADASPPEPLALATRVDGGSAVIALRGELDLSTVDLLSRATREVLEHRPAELVVDLSAVEFMDSSGLRVLLDLRNTAKRNRLRLVAVPGPSHVQRIFALTGTRGLFDWRDA